MVNKTKKFVFIHVPKCGGSSIQECSYFKGWSGNSHLTLEDYHRSILHPYSYKYYSIVRNPWSRILSVYTYWKQMKPSHKNYVWDQAVCRKIQDSNMSFKEFLIKVSDSQSHFRKTHEPNVEMPHVKTQYSFLSINGKLKMDFVGKMESLQQDFDFICKSIGIPRQDLPHVNKSDHGHYSEYYDDETKDIVSKVYRDDIKYFNYKFGE